MKPTQAQLRAAETAWFVTKEAAPRTSPSKDHMRYIKAIAAAIQASEPFDRATVVAMPRNPHRFTAAQRREQAGLMEGES